MNKNRNYTMNTNILKAKKLFCLEKYEEALSLLNKISMQTPNKNHKIIITILKNNYLLQL